MFFWYRCHLVGDGWAEVMCCVAMCSCDEEATKNPFSTNLTLVKSDIFSNSMMLSKNREHFPIFHDIKLIPNLGEQFSSTQPYLSSSSLCTSRSWFQKITSNSPMDFQLKTPLSGFRTRQRIQNQTTNSKISVKIQNKTRIQNKTSQFDLR